MNITETNEFLIYSFDHMNRIEISHELFPEFQEVIRRGMATKQDVSPEMRKLSDAILNNPSDWPINQR